MSNYQIYSPEVLRYWLALYRVEGVGNKTFFKLLENHAPEHIFALSEAELKQLDLKSSVIEAIKNTDWKAVDYDLEWLSQENNHVLTIDNPHYPELLKEIYDPPALLFVRGNVDILTYPQIAIVGSRNPSQSGAKTAFDFAHVIAKEGFVITSGLAVGIDGASHRGALDAKGYTIAVAGTGLDRIYPASHKDLALDIVKTGAIISEFPPATNAKSANFPRRNRIISGLCRGLLVVEAAAQSGSLITARMAIEQNRDVFAIPGSIYNPLSKGCNALIREGAHLVESPQDIIDELSQYKQRINYLQTTPNQSILDLEQQKLLNLVMFSPTSVDYLVENTQYSADMISSMLLLLELQGCVEAVAGGCYTRIK